MFRYVDLNKKYWVWIVAVLTATVSTLFSVSIGFQGLESKLYDLRLGLSPQFREDPGIVLITLDNKTANELREFAPLSLGQHARVLEALYDYNPRGIGYLIPLTAVKTAQLEQWENPIIMSSFLTQIEKLKQSQIPLIFSTTFNEGSELVPPYPLSYLPHAISPLNLDQSFVSGEKEIKVNVLSFNEKNTLLPELIKLTGSSSTPIGYSFDSASKIQYQLFRYHGNVGQAYARYSMIDVIEKRIAPELLKNKLILVGSLSPDSPKDYSWIPAQNKLKRISQLEVHANMLDSLLNQDGVERMSTGINLIIALVVTTTTLLLVSLLTPGAAMISALAWNLVFFVFAWITFHYSTLGPTGVWVELSIPLMGSIMGCFVVFPFRWLREYRKRFQVEQKNKLLLQVEELKNNFMSLVTHDLKTPVAKIQGLAEVVLSKAHDRLLDRDKETIRSIISSSDELNHFISSILELHNIDSNRLAINFESKDINTIIEDCLEGFEAPARSRKIKIESHLDPLFPIKLDSGLITKVLNNLIDNAIKYSKDESTLTIKSSEVGDSVRIEIQDQGLGLTPIEIKSLFSRFYRAKNDTTHRVIGTGLGLYLVKYFVEQIHQGSVSVQSKPGVGSTFIISLPIEQKQTGFAPGLSIDLLENQGKQNRAGITDV
ncbi:MAG: CHASE2 domain-containing protein [Xanthomonadaceae bacterium]|nr:CHASE2 domain-containing protein [Xanthomonadaceae bacterium]